MDCSSYNILATGIVVIEKAKLAFINESAQKILGWSFDKLEEVYPSLSRLSPDLINLEKIILELQNSSEHSSLSKNLIINMQNYRVVMHKNQAISILELSPNLQHDIKQSTHELKRPIQNIKTLTETLLLGAKDDPVKSIEYLQKLNQEVDRLGSMVTDMLFLSFVLSRDLELNKQEINLQARIANILASLETKLQAKSIQVKNLIPDEVLVIADTKLFDHALANILDNAIKYNQDQGSITIALENNVLQIQDSGLGMKEEDLAKIFSEFYRSSQHAHIQGTGLGLAIVKAISDLHGWEIEVNSQLGSGTSFGLTLSTIK